MVISVILLVSSSFISEMMNEIGMDTYPYGTDPTPIVRTFSGRSVLIDSVSDSFVYGRIALKPVVWDSNGKCLNGNKEHRLVFNELFYEYGRK